MSTHCHNLQYDATSTTTHLLVSQSKFLVLNFNIATTRVSFFFWAHEYRGVYHNPIAGVTGNFQQLFPTFGKLIYLVVTDLILHPISSNKYESHWIYISFLVVEYRGGHSLIRKHQFTSGAAHEHMQFLDLFYIFKFFFLGCRISNVITESPDWRDSGCPGPLPAYLYHDGRHGVATVSRLLKIIGLLCRISSLLKGSFSKETNNRSLLIVATSYHDGRPAAIG